MYLQIKSGLINLLLEATGILHIRSSFILVNLSHFFSSTRITTHLKRSHIWNFGWKHRLERVFIMTFHIRNLECVQSMSQHSCFS